LPFFFLLLLCYNNNIMDLQIPIQYIRGVGPRKAALFKRLGVETVEDACLYLPRRYEDRRHLKDIVHLEPGQMATVIGEVQMAGVTTTPKRKKKIFEVVVSDRSGIVTAKWFKFNANYMKQIFSKGQRLVLSGVLQVNTYSQWGKEMHHPEYEFLSGDDEDLIHCGRIVPVYPATEGLTQRSIRSIMKRLIDEAAADFGEILPETLCRRHRLIPLSEAIAQVHFPESPYDNLEQLNQHTSPPQRRLIFEELFLLQLGLALRKQGLDQEAKGIAFKAKGKLLAGLWKLLPFRLTKAQQRVIREIKNDMARPHPMQRLLQGDVGSGKTIVALAAILLAVENGYQAAIMAPTEILAEQHYLKIHHLLEQLGLKTAVLTGRVKGKQKKQILARIEAKEVEVVIGTHALIQEEVRFACLGLVVVDEQHKFGVAQRLLLQRKGQNAEGCQADLLVMSATPIPRSLALTVYGDLSLSVLDEMPPGRRPVKTHLRYDSARPKIYSFLQQEAEKGRQAYIVYPLVEESEKLQLRAATEMYEHFRQEVFPRLRVGLIHGRMPGEQKEQVMKTFRQGELDILVATTVIEVGIDIPNASLMLIEHAERFGLAQLHQLRGLVGRGEQQAHCILLAHYPLSEEAKQRLQVMVNTSDGFAIAEADLELRGPGDFWGTRQSGLPDLRIAHILRDASLLETARQEAFALVETDPHLRAEEHKPLLDAVEHKWADKLALMQAG